MAISSLNIIQKLTASVIEVEGDQLVPELADLCASFQYAVMKHLCTRVQRGMGFLDLEDLMPKNERTLVCMP